MNPRRWSPTRMVGVFGVFFVFIIGFYFSGGNPLVLLEAWTGMLIVFGMTGFALLATYGMDALRFFRDSFFAPFCRSEPHERYVEIAESGSRYAMGSAGIGFVAGLIVTMSCIDGPIVEVGHYIAYSMVSIVWGLFLSELYFPFLAKVYQPVSGSPSPNRGRGVFLMGLCMMGLFAVFMCRWIVGSSQWGTWSEEGIPEKISSSAGMEEEYSPHRSGVEMKEEKAPRLKLSEIELPEKPTDDQVREYIRKIVRSAEGRRSWSSADPEIQKLEMVGSQHVNLLVEEVMSRGERDYHLLAAIENLVGEQHKEIILKNLSFHPEFAGVVIKMHWEEDARQILVKRLERNSNYLPLEWMQAVANLKDPSTYPLLKRYLVEGMNRSHTYRFICDLPGMDLDKEVGEAWKRVLRGDPHGMDDYERNDFADIAARHGFLDALGVLVEKNDAGFGYDMKPDEWRIKKNRKSFYKLTGQSGTDEENRAWFQENKNKLVFDPEIKMYKLPGDFKGVPEPKGDPSQSSSNKLFNIKLQDDPTDDQVRDYVQKILLVSKEKGRRASDDPEVEKLMQVGKGKLNILLEACEGKDGFYVLCAIEGLADESHKSLILKKLAAQHGLVTVILEKQWEKDAKNILLEELSSHMDGWDEDDSWFVHFMWVRAIAKLKDPTTYPLLKKYFIKARYKELVYDNIRNLPGIDLEKTIISAWKAVKNGDREEKMDMAKIAAENGVVEALGYMVEELNAKNSASNSSRDEGWWQKIRGRFRGLTRQSGTDEECLAWFQKNKGKLVFDLKAGIYKVKELE